MLKAWIAYDAENEALKHYLARWHELVNLPSDKSSLSDYKISSENTLKEF